MEPGALLAAGRPDGVTAGALRDVLVADGAGGGGPVGHLLEQLWRDTLGGAVIRAERPTGL